MTCIVAIAETGRVWMAADAQASNNGAVMINAAPKIVQRETLGRTLFGSDGSLWLGDAFRYGILPVRHAGQSLAEWCAVELGPWLRERASEGNRWYDRNGGKEWNGQTLVANGSDLVLVDSAGSVVVPIGGRWAIGSGGAEARGALWAMDRDGSAMLAHQRATLAVAAACALDDGCREPIECVCTAPE